VNGAHPPAGFLDHRSAAIQVQQVGDEDAVGVDPFATEGFIDVGNLA